MRETVKVERPVLIIFHDAQNVMFRRILYCSEHFWSRARRNLYCIWNHDISQSLWLAPINLNVAQIEKIFWQWIVSSFHGHEGSLQIRSRSAQIVTTAVNFKSGNQRCRTEWWLDLFRWFSRTSNGFNFQMADFNFQRLVVLALKWKHNNWSQKIKCELSQNCS